MAWNMDNVKIWNEVWKLEFNKMAHRKYNKQWQYYWWQRLFSNKGQHYIQQYKIVACDKYVLGAKGESTETVEQLRWLSTWLKSLSEVHNSRASSHKSTVRAFFARKMYKKSICERLFQLESPRNASWANANLKLTILLGRYSWRHSQLNNKCFESRCCNNKTNRRNVKRDDICTRSDQIQLLIIGG